MNSHPASPGHPRTGQPITALHLQTYRVPTHSFGQDQPESDGTACWDSTAVLVAEITAGEHTGLGYAYADPAAAQIARHTLWPLLEGEAVLDTTQHFWAMAGAVRNLGWPGVAAGAISALDVALHDLKARMLNVPLFRLLGGARKQVMAYGSGGFTSQSVEQLQQQLGGWAGQGFRAVKMKIGRHPENDLGRVRAARAAIGDDVALFVDANGAYSRKQALGLAEQFADLNVRWFEEPVLSDDLAGLRLLRDRAPGFVQIAAGEYGYTPAYFHAMLAAQAVDTLQADATRCGGVTGFLLAAAQAQGANVPLSAHTAPALHASLGAALPNVVNAEYFHDHVRIEALFFEGVPTLDAGFLCPSERPGHGLSFKVQDARPYRVSEWRSK
ncbi:mandelate racemase [Deinococcus irradiatisoli]|uniref:Mandelate racemase n=1 Tax=Deinococcus irradiatisoli TaxID=2202254 RepID=A0A2Z3JC83_9DEIO|nr:enolase C-terminal domain-like protein [Deinococcus irradiatisoli]AWN22763.1 mandelate racemase [Deinococcus irradiatisoli]